jgi:predicted AAA+ superfamily ATPase
MADLSLRRVLSEKLADSLIGPLQLGTPRNLPTTLVFPQKATAISGMRRAGKTTLLHQIRQQWIDQGHGREQCPFLNFEDERLVGLEGQDLHLLLEEYYRLYPSWRGQPGVLWCFDEIQVVPGWEQFVRRVLDSERVQVYVSGSSAALLSREVATSMRGRAWQFILHPFSFSEYLRHHGLHSATRSLTAAGRSRLERAFLDYLDSGGFPEAQGLARAARFQLLRDYVDVAILRDVVDRHRVTNVVGLRWLVRHLLSNAAGSFSVEKFYAALRSQGISISKDTVHQLLAHLEDCFLIRTVWVEADSERRRMVNPRKCYPIDQGLIPVFDRNGRSNLGHALETSVFLELERRGWEVTYVRNPTGSEIDFLARPPGGQPELLQICADASSPDTLARELRAFEEASQLHPEATKRLLVLTQDGLPARAPAGVDCQTAYEWMLEQRPSI